MKPDPCLPRDPARVVRRVDPEAAARLAERLAARPGAGVGAMAVGPLRRVPTVAIVCAAVVLGGVSAPRIVEAVFPPKASEVVESFGVRHVTPVPAPGGALIFVPAVLALAWLRRPVRGDRMRVGSAPGMSAGGVARPAGTRGAAGHPPGFLPIDSARRGGPHGRAARLFGGGRV